MEILILIALVLIIVVQVLHLFSSHKTKEWNTICVAKANKQLVDEVEVLSKRLKLSDALLDAVSRDKFDQTSLAITPTGVSLLPKGWRDMPLVTQE